MLQSGSDDIEIADSWKQPLREAFAALYWATDSIPELDSILNIYCVHHFPSAPSGLYVYPDTTYAWVKGWKAVDSITTHPQLDSFIARYDLEVNYWGFNDHRLHWYHACSESVSHYGHSRHD